MEKNKKTKWNNERFEYGDKRLKELFEKQNKLFEQSKFAFKKIGKKKLKSVKKVNYKDVQFQTSDFEESVKKFYFSTLNDVTMEYLEDVSQNAYEYAIKEVKRMFPNNKKIQEKELSKIKNTLIDEWTNKYISNLKIDYINNLGLQATYLTYRLVDSFNDNKQNSEENENEILNMNSATMLAMYKTQKKKFANLTDNIFMYVILKSMITAYEDLGVEKVIRVAELDDRTCEDCIELDGTVYILGKEPEVMLHSFCRCYYEPYVD